MENNENKPKHTQGEWRVTTDGEANFFGIATEKGWLMRIQQNGEMQVVEQIANAERIVKCVNMHNELIQAIKDLVEHCNVMPNSKCPESLNPYGKLVSLINQAEQK